MRNVFVGFIVVGALMLTGCPEGKRTGESDAAVNDACANRCTAGDGAVLVDAAVDVRVVDSSFVYVDSGTADSAIVSDAVVVADSTTRECETTTIIDCAAPPEGCNYVGGNNCSCGRLVCGEACGDMNCVVGALCIARYPGIPPQDGSSGISYECRARGACADTNCSESSCSVACQAMCFAAPVGISIQGNNVSCFAQ